MLWLLENPQPSENPDFGTQAHTIHVGHIYLHLVDFCGFHVIKYASPMDPMGNTYQSLIHNAGLDSPRSNQKLFPGDSFVVSEQRKGAKSHSSWKQRWSFSLPKITNPNEDHEVK